MYRLGGMRDIRSYETLELLGSGQFGQVVLVRRIADRKLFAAKVSHGENVAAKQIARHEAALMMRLHHVNIIQCFELVDDDAQLAIVMEYASGGDLDTFLHLQHENMECLSEPAIMRIFIQVVLALQYLHEHHVLHRDLKPKNILLDGDGIVKLSDFGASKVLKNTLDAAQTVTGTPYYMAPELLEGAEYNGKSDIWSLGCVLYELATYSPPFTGLALGAVVHQILHNDPLPIPQRFSPPFRVLVSWLLDKNPHNRPSLSDILSCDALQHHMRQLVSVATSHQPMLLEQFMAGHNVHRPSLQEAAAENAVPSALVSPLNAKDAGSRAQPIGNPTTNTKEPKTKLKQKTDPIRELFFENQAAARRNKERVDEERSRAAVFLDCDAGDPPQQRMLRQWDLVSDAGAPSNSLLAAIAVQQPPPAPLSADPPKIRAKSCPDKYEELLEAERRRVRLETKALQERMRAVYMRD